nr:MAG TPA: hypothetical protein [Bacteriophage sp.]
MRKGNHAGGGLNMTVKQLLGVIDKKTMVEVRGEHA